VVQPTTTEYGRALMSQCASSGEAVRASRTFDLFCRSLDLVLTIENLTNDKWGQWKSDVGTSTSAGGKRRSS
jgi:hypothetical protein